MRVRGEDLPKGMTTRELAEISQALQRHHREAADFQEAMLCLQAGMRIEALRTCLFLRDEPGSKPLKEFLTTANPRE